MALHPTLQAYALARVRHALDHAAGMVRGVDVRLSEAGGGHAGLAPRRRTAEFTVRTLGRGIVRVEDEEDDMHAAVDLAAHKLRRKMDRLKNRARPRRGVGLEEALGFMEEEEEWEEEKEVGWGAAQAPGATVPGAEMEPGTDGAQGPGIVRNKVVFMEELMSPMDAVEQMEQVGHSFFVFQDGDDRLLKIVYKRR